MAERDRERAFAFIRTNHRPPKPRKTGLTEIRGPYYTPMGKRYLEDVLETMGAYVDSLKFAGGSFALMPRAAVGELIDLCHRHDVLVSTGGFLEYVLRQSCDAVGPYIQECKELGFDIVEISCGFITIPIDDWIRLVQQVKQAGLKPKPEIGVQFGAGGATTAEELAAEGASLLLCSRSEEAINQAANEIAQATGAKVLAVAADVSKTDEIARLTQFGFERFGRIDILVTNAGGPPATVFDNTDLEMFRDAFELNGLSAIRLAKLVLPAMREL